MCVNCLCIGPCWHVHCAATYLFAASVCLSFVRFSVHCAIGYGNVYVYGHIYKCFVMFCLVVLFFCFCSAMSSQSGRTACPSAAGPAVMWRWCSWRVPAGLGVAAGGHGSAAEGGRLLSDDRLPLAAWAGCGVPAGVSAGFGRLAFIPFIDS